MGNILTIISSLISFQNTTTKKFNTLHWYFKHSYVFVNTSKHAIIKLP